jgi:hypothetical protein
MKTTHMPGFTAEASLYQRSAFGMVTVTVSQNTTEHVQPAMSKSGACYDIGHLMYQASDNGNDGLANFLWGVFVGLGCLT